MTIQWGAVVKALPLAENCVSLAFFQPNATLQNLGFPPNAILPGTATPALVLRCPSSKDANALYALMWSRRELMADPRGMPDPQHKSSSENPLGSGNGSEEGWTCPVCTLHNASPLSLACEACGSVKPHNNNTNGSSGGGGSSGSGSGSGGGGEVYAFGTANTPNKMGVSSAEANLDERKLLEVRWHLLLVLLFTFKCLPRIDFFFKLCPLFCLRLARCRKRSFPMRSAKQTVNPR